MSDLSDLYQQLILDHGKRPRNLRAIDDADRTAEGYNPLCGDHVTVYVKLLDRTLDDVSFTGAGCAICTASASLMTQAVKGRREADAEAMFEAFHDLLTRETASGNGSQQNDIDLGKLEALAGVKKYPIRVKCATLPWHTLHAALQGGGRVSTE
jgi:nitrogen fixation protein NifU and related proteins